MYMYTYTYMVNFSATRGSGCCTLASASARRRASQESTPSVENCIEEAESGVIRKMIYED